MPSAKILRLPLRRRFLLECKETHDGGPWEFGTLKLEFSPTQWAGLLYEYSKVASAIDERRYVVIPNWVDGKINWLPFPFPTDKEYIELDRDAESLEFEDQEITWDLNFDHDGAFWTGEREGIAYLSKPFRLRDVAV